MNIFRKNKMSQTISPALPEFAKGAKLLYSLVAATRVASPKDYGRVALLLEMAGISFQDFFHRNRPISVTPACAPLFCGTTAFKLLLGQQDMISRPHRDLRFNRFAWFLRCARVSELDTSIHDAANEFLGHYAILSDGKFTAAELRELREINNEYSRPDTVLGSQISLRSLLKAHGKSAEEETRVYVRKNVNKPPTEEEYRLLTEMARVHDIPINDLLNGTPFLCSPNLVQPWMPNISSTI